jgi:hypothetical protein
MLIQKTVNPAMHSTGLARTDVSLFQADADEVALNTMALRVMTTA